MRKIASLPLLRNQRILLIAKKTRSVDKLFLPTDLINLIYRIDQNLLIVLVEPT